MFASTVNHENAVLVSIQSFSRNERQAVNSRYTTGNLITGFMERAIIEINQHFHT